MRSTQRAGKVVLVIVITAGTILAHGETRKEFRFTVSSANPKVSLNNPYGSIAVRPASGNIVLVTAVLHSDKVAIDQNQHGNRIEIASHLLPGADTENGQVDYEIQVPAETNLTVRATSGQVKAEKLRGDISVEAVSSNVDIRDINDTHVHVRTMNGPVTLNNIKNTHVDVTSISGNVMLTSVAGRSISVNSSSGKILYDGDFGSGGEYTLHSYSGDIEATAPAAASIEVLAESRGKIDSDFPLESRPQTSTVKGIANTFVGSIGKAWSSVKLRSFSGRIHLKKR